ncbi:MAG: hypothetical protein P3W90_004275 [Paracoccus sp. (in: a-proteobacteria)]|nr:hypothetical protein [Paracoccus sp. (in: a-proteobacteria)]
MLIAGFAGLMAGAMVPLIVVSPVAEAQIAVLMAASTIIGLGGAR